MAKLDRNSDDDDDDDSNNPRWFQDGFTIAQDSFSLTGTTGTSGMIINMVLITTIAAMRTANTNTNKTTTTTIAMTETKTKTTTNDYDYYYYCYSSTIKGSPARTIPKLGERHEWRITYQMEWDPQFFMKTDSGERFLYVEDARTVVALRLAVLPAVHRVPRRSPAADRAAHHAARRAAKASGMEEAGCRRSRNTKRKAGWDLDPASSSAMIAPWFMTSSSGEDELHDHVLTGTRQFSRGSQDPS